MTPEEMNQFIIQFNEISYLRQRKKLFHYPNFICVGAGRCGTSSVYKYLSEHPEVYMSPIKEINYFGIRDIETNKNGITFSEYSYYFLGKQETQVCVGEISPAYLTLPESALQIKELLKDVKILIFLRDPIERAISQYKHHVNQHQQKDINEYFINGLKKRSTMKHHEYRFQWFDPAKNIAQSMYSEGVQQYLELFGSNLVKIMRYDDLKNTPSLFLDNLCDFLQINQDDSSKTLSKENSSSNELTVNTKLNHEVKNQLLELFKPDLANLDKMTGLETELWLDKY